MLLTAFEPFDASGRNASLEACRLFLARWRRDFDLAFAVLPVRYGADVEAVNRCLAEAPADLVLHTGQCGGADSVRVERIAVNARYAGEAPDDGDGRSIDPSGPVALLATVPVEAIAAAIRAAGVPARVSHHAGIYLCNHVFYHSLLAVARGDGPPRVGFLHLPRLPEQVTEGGPALPAEASALAIRVALETVAQRPD